MPVLSELCPSHKYRATNENGETKSFFLKVIAYDWAGKNGKVERVSARDDDADMQDLVIQFD